LTARRSRSHQRCAPRRYASRPIAKSLPLPDLSDGSLIPRCILRAAYGASGRFRGVWLFSGRPL
jgi:hypothetical protein